MTVAMLVGGGACVLTTKGRPFELRFRDATLLTCFTWIVVPAVAAFPLLADPTGIGVVLEGWAFNPADIDQAVRAMFPDGSAGLRILHEIEHVAVSVASGEGRV